MHVCLKREGMVVWRPEVVDKLVLVDEVVDSMGVDEVGRVWGLAVVYKWVVDSKEVYEEGRV